MGYCRFLESLLSEGRGLVAEPAPIPGEQLQSGDSILARYERIWRRQIPDPVPQFDSASARWGAVWLYRACQFAVYRDVDEAAVERALGGRFPGEIGPGICYSVDLVLRFLPDLEKFARLASAGDPLVGHLKDQAVRWPLSSVGIPGMGALTVDGFALHPGLMQLYADRIIAAEDTSRLSQEEARRQVESSLGTFPELWPRFAADASGTRVGVAK